MDEYMPITVTQTLLEEEGFGWSGASFRRSLAHDMVASAHRPPTPPRTMAEKRGIFDARRDLKVHQDSYNASLAREQYPDPSQRFKLSQSDKRIPVDHEGNVIGEKIESGNLEV